MNLRHGDSFETKMFGSSSFFRQRLPLTALRFKKLRESIYLSERRGYTLFTDEASRFNRTSQFDPQG